MSFHLDNARTQVMIGIESDDHSNTTAGNPNGLTDIQKPFKTTIAEQPVTEARKPFFPLPASVLQNAGTARATLAASREKPNGTTDNDYAGNHKNQTVVQQHVEYWDTDHDGMIWPQDTYIGCRKWGWSPPLAALVTFIINFNLSYPTLPGFLPDPFFRIYVNKIYKDKHGSDSMTYDNEGRFRPQNFEDIFAKYDEGHKGGLDIWDFLRFWKGQRMVFDFFGWSATFLECTCSKGRYPRARLIVFVELAAVEQSLLSAKLECNNLPFLDTKEAQRDFLSEAKTFVAAYCYLHTKSSSGQKASPLIQSSDTQQKEQDIDQKRAATAQALLAESAQVLQNAGYNPQPDLEGEPLTEFTLRRSISLPLRPSQQNELAGLPPDNAGLMNSQPETPTGIHADASIDNDSSSGLSEPPNKRRKLSDSKPHKNQD